MYQPNYERIAQKIVRESLRVQPGEQVLLYTRHDAVPYSELIAGEVSAVGGVATMVLHSDNLRHAQLTDSLIETLHLPERPLVEALLTADYNVTVGLLRGDPNRFRDLPIERARAFNERRMAASDAIYRPGGKWLGTDYPTRQMAEVYGIPWEQFFEMYWRAMDLDYTSLRERAARLVELLEQTDSVHITTPHGTDLRLRRGNRSIHKDDGTVIDYANLPSGEVYFAPLEGSAEGRVIYDTVFHEGQRIHDLEFRFEGGVGTPVGASDGFEIFLDHWNSHTGGKEHIGEMGIGINSEIRTPTGYLLTDEKVMGTVHLALGDNEFIGGTNRSSLHWDMLLLQPTVTLDHHLLLDRGRFLLE